MAVVPLQTRLARAAGAAPQSRDPRSQLTSLEGPSSSVLVERGGLIVVVVGIVVAAIAHFLVLLQV